MPRKERKRRSNKIKKMKNDVIFFKEAEEKLQLTN
jgi:hypothetical protein